MKGQVDRRKCMELSLSKVDLGKYVSSQLNTFFPDGYSVDINSNSKKGFEWALARVEVCFRPIKLNSYKKNGETFFNHLYSDQYAVFLWLLSNSIWVEHGDSNISNKLFYLNKALHGFSCNYDTNLPNIFMLMHTVGTVLGKASYSDYLIASQGSTVGAQDGVYPTLGKACSLLPYSSVVGACTLGNNVSIGIHASVYKTNVENDTIVFRDTAGQMRHKTVQDCWANSIFDL